jgi:hypothetical protein
MRPNEDRRGQFMDVRSILRKAAQETVVRVLSVAFLLAILATTRAYLVGEATEQWEPGGAGHGDTSPGEHKEAP